MELLEMLFEFLPRLFSSVFVTEGRCIRCTLTGLRLDLDNLGISPLEACARLIQVRTAFIYHLHECCTFVIFCAA